MSLARLLITWRPTCGLMLRRKSKNINSPVPTLPPCCACIPGIPVCCTHFIPAHPRQRYTASQLPTAVRTVLWHYIFSLQENWAGLSWVTYSAFPIADCRNCFLWEEAFRLGSYIRRFMYNLGNACHVMLCELHQYNPESHCEILSIFRCVEPVKVLL